MKIALVLPGGVDRGGEQRVIPVFLALIERLARAHQVHVFVLHQESEAGTWSLRGATIHNIGEGRTVWRGIAAIRAEHRRAPFDVVQSIFSGHCGLIGVVAATSLRLPVFVHIAGGELVALHAIGYGGRRKWRGRLREAVTLRMAKAVTAASMPIVDALHALGVPATRVPLGVDVDAWTPLPPRPRGDRLPKLIHVASLNRVKDQATLLRALAILANAGVDFDMRIVGVDTLGGEMQELARCLGIERRVTFLGFRTQAELRPLVASSDLLVMSSLHEAGPLVLLEAAVAGVPTVGTAVGHIAEWANVAALAVPVGDANALADAMARVLDDDALRMRLAGEAQRRALAEDADHTAVIFEDMYRTSRPSLP
ncbi:glycosyltransferase involved in cell wall biosynthesis [Luteibacter jiangsuensis]|uniref:Glycosyltransferase involved in cell wall biosynthesis n=1 Tax=Luteibacter jiangsuensis TaxID=637577 RepID=A0ABT9T2F1_9GAMM|nr:glycosyltransferase family 4 protein [Luteibacter jiangsuensis]MDQ0010791.1 glycosyltransferase involved in cell wall biosynthesis [Luteibacter jiangsuensis]